MAVEILFEGQYEAISSVSTIEKYLDLIFYL